MTELNEQELSALRTAAMFSSLPEEVIRDLTAGCRKLDYGPTEMICQPAERAKFFFVILAGHVKLFHIASDKTDRILSIIGPGQSFGEAATLRGLNYPAYGEAVDHVKILPIDKETFQGAVRRNIEIVTALVLELSVKLKEQAFIARRQGLANLPTRLVAFLLKESRGAGSGAFELPQPRKKLAEQIGTDDETLGRMLDVLNSRGLIKMDGRRVTIIDAEALRSLAGISRKKNDKGPV